MLPYPFYVYKTLIVKFLKQHPVNCLRSIRWIFIALIVIYSTEYSFSQKENDYCGLFQKTIRLYNENSIHPIEPEKFNIKQFQDDFLSSADPYSILFTTNDLGLFSSIQDAVREDGSKSYCAIETNLLESYKKSIENTIEVFEDLKTTEFDFNRMDSVYIGYGPVQNTFGLDKNNRCRLYIKSLIIRNIIESTATYDSIKKDSKAFNSFIDSIKTKKINKEIDILKKLLGNPTEFRSRLFSSYINSFIVQYDPYAFVFSGDAYNQFKEQLSTSSSLFGFRLETNLRGEIIIASVIPGSSAWRSGMINPGDKVLKLEKDNKTSIDLEESEMNEIIDFLSNITTEKLTITLYKADNKIKAVDLYREKLETIENSVQAFILNSEQKVGYIILPAFYTSWERQNQFGCAQDVGRAIYYLKKNNIESLIIDLRNNSGGSIIEAIDLAGIFVDFGTLSVAQNKNKELTSIKDFNRGTLYSGPLALLVNSNSASASEMVAAVLQDYNRAIIIGDTTFGKATGQTLLPLDKESKNIIKFTTKNYYRVTGKTYNAKGVVPDIALPYYSQNSIYKKKNIYSPALDSINKKTYYKPLKAIPIKDLYLKSYARILSNAQFQKRYTIDSVYSNFVSQNSYLPLNLDSYYDIIRQKELFDNQVDSFIASESDSFTVELLPKDKELFNTNTYYSDLYNTSIKYILSDPYIDEALKIVSDYTTIKKNEHD
jgi:carboxyl-terminal processing protease